MKKAVAGCAILVLASCGAPSPGEGVDNGFDLANLDTTYQPCEDFFFYSSGGWQKANPVPSTEGAWGPAHELNERTNEQVLELLNDLAQSSYKKGTPEQLVADFWFAAMDSNTVNDLGYKPMKAHLQAADGFESGQFAEFVAKFMALGYATPWSVYVGPDDKRSQFNALQLYQSGLGLPNREYYLQADSGSAEIKRAYKAHVQTMFALAGERDSATALANRVYQTEHALAMGMMDKVTSRNADSTYNKWGVDRLQTEDTGINWPLFFQGIGVHPDTVLIAQPKYLFHVGKLVNELPEAHWKAYFKWKVITRSAPYLSEAFIKEDFDFYNRLLQGVNEMKPRWKTMIDATNGAIGFAVGKLYVEEYFDQESKARVEEMVENLRKAFSERIAQLDWMSDTTKAKAQEKLKAFTYKIGYPEEWETYNGLAIDRKDLFGNVLRASQWEFKRNLSQLNKPVDRTEWYMPPQVVNAYYNPAFNEVVFPAAILQPPFYNPEADDALNYGSIGAVIGHEFSHGFDDQGSKYDGQGNLVDWWTAGDRQRFEARTAQLVAQYDAFEPLPGVHVNGALTLGENIADLAGLTMAYYAYQLSRAGKEQPDPVDGFTHLQRFFLGWGQVWATTITEESLRIQIETDYHSPGQYRAKGPVRNLVEFHEAWGCGPGDAMYLPPKERVVLW